MPEYGRYEKSPRPESIAKLIEYLQKSKVVESVERPAEQVLVVKRTALKKIKVFMTNVYTIGEADIYEITGATTGLGAIVTMSAWNGYSCEAKALCRSMDIGLFKFTEFLGAVYFDGRKYFDYVPPEERERLRRKKKLL